MRPALILMSLAATIAVVKAFVGAPVFDGVTVLVFVLVVASLTVYYRASGASRADR